MGRIATLAAGAALLGTAAAGCDGAAAPADASVGGHAGIAGSAGGGGSGTGGGGAADGGTGGTGGTGGQTPQDAGLQPDVPILIYGAAVALPLTPGQSSRLIR